MTSCQTSLRDFFYIERLILVRRDSMSHRLSKKLFCFLKILFALASAITTTTNHISRRSFFLNLFFWWTRFFSCFRIGIVSGERHMNSPRTDFFEIKRSDFILNNKIGAHWGINKALCHLFSKILKEKIFCNSFFCRLNEEKTRSEHEILIFLMDHMRISEHKKVLWLLALVFLCPLINAMFFSLVFHLPTPV